MLRFHPTKKENLEYLVKIVIRYRKNRKEGVLNTHVEGMGSKVKFRKRLDEIGRNRILYYGHAYIIETLPSDLRPRAFKLQKQVTYERLRKTLFKIATKLSFDKELKIGKYYPYFNDKYHEEPVVLLQGFYDADDAIYIYKLMYGAYIAKHIKLVSGKEAMERGYIPVQSVRTKDFKLKRILRVPHMASKKERMKAVWELLDAYLSVKENKLYKEKAMNKLFIHENLGKQALSDVREDLREKRSELQEIQKINQISKETLYELPD